MNNVAYWENIVTGGLFVPEHQNFFENLKASYYFDMIRQGVLYLCTFYTTLLEPKLPSLTWKYTNWAFLSINILYIFCTFDWPDTEMEKQEVNVRPR